MAMDSLQTNKHGGRTSSTKQSRDLLAQWLFALMAHVPAPNSETQSAQKGKVFLYCEALSDRTRCAKDASLKAALKRFKFFPTVSELTEFFDEYEQNDPDWIPPESDFEPPYELAGVFNALRSAVGPASYRSWLRGCEAWRGRDDAIHIKAPDAAKAKWVRDRYAEKLEYIAQCPVRVECVDKFAPQRWPHKGPASTQDAWWQTNDRWKRDNAGGLTQVMDGIFDHWSK